MHAYKNSEIRLKAAIDAIHDLFIQNIDGRTGFNSPHHPRRAPTRFEGATGEEIDYNNEVQGGV